MTTNLVADGGYILDAGAAPVVLPPGLPDVMDAGIYFGLDEAEYHALLNRGRWLGYGWVAMDMGRTEEQGRARIKYLRRKCPDICAEYPKPRTGE